MQTYQIIYLTAVALAILEIFTTTFIFLGFSIGTFAVGLIEQLFEHANYSIDLFVFVITSGIAIYLFRKFFHDSEDVKKFDGDVNQY